jgi:hypothetical protein
MQELLIIKAGGTYIYHQALKGLIHLQKIYVLSTCVISFVGSTFWVPLMRTYYEVETYFYEMFNKKRNSENNGHSRRCSGLVVKRLQTPRSLLFWPISIHRM